MPCAKLDRHRQLEMRLRRDHSAHYDSGALRSPASDCPSVERLGPPLDDGRSDAARRAAQR